MPLQPPEASGEVRFTVAVVAGGRPGFGSATAALEGARTLITHLQTAAREDSAGACPVPWQPLVAVVTRVLPIWVLLSRCPGRRCQGTSLLARLREACWNSCSRSNSRSSLKDAAQHGDLASDARLETHRLRHRTCSPELTCSR